MVHPAAKGINVREELIKFHECLYSSNLMSLCVLGKGEYVYSTTETVSMCAYYWEHVSLLYTRKCIEMKVTDNLYPLQCSL